MDESNSQSKSNLEELSSRYIREGEDEKIGNGFSFRRRKAENGKVIWMQKYWFFQRKIRANFSDFTDFGSKVVLGGRASGHQTLFGSGTSHIWPSWVTLNSFSSIKALEDFLVERKAEQ